MRTHRGGGNSESGERIEEAAEEEDALREGQGVEAESGGAESLDFAGATAPGAATGNGQKTGAITEENEPAAQNGEADAETAGVYAFPDTKTSGTVTVVKKWDDQSTNTERPSVDMVNINLSTQKPSKNPLGYTVTFHADAEKGLTFADGSTENDVVYNSSGQIVSGAYKGLTEGSGVVRWYTDKTYKEQIVLDENGQITKALTDDIDVWPREVTFEMKGHSFSWSFNWVIPNSTTTVVFTDELMPADAVLINVDADRDGGVVAWTETNGTVMKVSSQTKGVKVQAAQDSSFMFSGKSKIQTIDFANLDTAKVTNMNKMFYGCSGLTSLDVSSFDTANVTYMDGIFSNCSSLTSLDLSSLDTSKVTSMSGMFDGCSSLTSLDVSVFDTSQVTDMNDMFSGCSGLTSLDVSSFDTANVTKMSYMFWCCSGLTSLDVSSFDTAKVTNVQSMFDGCRGLTSLDLSSFDTANVTKMSLMFWCCSGLTSLDVSSFNTAKVTDMSLMFSSCGKLTSLDVSSFDTANVTNMYCMFDDCRGLTNLDLSSFDTAKVTDMRGMFAGCNWLTSLTAGITFRFVGTSYGLYGTWRNTAGETFTSGNFPSNVADTYTKIAS